MEHLTVTDYVSVIKFLKNNVVFMFSRSIFLVDYPTSVKINTYVMEIPCSTLLRFEILLKSSHLKYIM